MVSVRPLGCTRPIYQTLGFQSTVLFYLEEPRLIPKVLTTFFIVSTHSQPGLFCTRFIGLILLHLLSMNQEGDPLTVKYNFRRFLIFFISLNNNKSKCLT